MSILAEESVLTSILGWNEAKCVKHSVRCTDIVTKYFSYLICLYAYFLLILMVCSVPKVWCKNSCHVLWYARVLSMGWNKRKSVKSPSKVSTKVDFVWKLAEHPQMLLSQDSALEHCAKTGAVSSRGNATVIKVRLEWLSWLLPNRFGSSDAKKLRDLQRAFFTFCIIILLLLSSLSLRA